MPKLLVVFSSVDSYAARIADAVGQGAKAVRFTEVDVRAVADRSRSADMSGRRRLEALEALRDYDGVVLAAPGPESTGHELGALLERLGADAPLPDTVFALAGQENAEMLEAMARTGGIIVGQPRHADAEECARRLGARVAKVVGWVRHALSHEVEHMAEHHHHHDHTH